MLIVYPGTQSINVLMIDFMFQYSNSSFIRFEVKYGHASLNTAFLSIIFGNNVLYCKSDYKY